MKFRLYTKTSCPYCHMAVRLLADHQKEFEVGVNFNPSEAAYDVSLYSVFESKETLQAYVVHPEHQKVVQFIGSIAENRVVVDYEA